MLRYHIRKVGIPPKTATSKEQLEHEIQKSRAYTTNFLNILQELKPLISEINDSTKP